MQSLHPRHHLDISAGDLLFAASGFHPRQDDRAIDSLAADISPHALVAFSVRSAWDLLLSALDLPEGSEVIMSALTIPDMARVAEAHGIVVIPIDIDPETMTPRLDLYAKAFGAKTRLVVLAHLLGGSFDIRPYVSFASTRGVSVVEDCAQAFEGPHTWGSVDALVSLFSFGSIKTSTSLGAAVAIVRNADVLSQMRGIQATHRSQDCARFARKAVRYLGLQPFHSPALYGGLAQLAAHSKGGLDAFISRTVKAFPTACREDFLAQLRQRPSCTQVALLRRRLERFDPERLAARMERGELLLEKLAGVTPVLGRKQPRRTHWLFAIEAENPNALIMRLRSAGFDATQGATTIRALAAPDDEPQFDPAVIRSAMSRAVFLPAYPEMPTREALRLIDSVKSAIS